MSYTLAAAAAACGVNKSTILRAIKSGKVSAAKDEHGEWHVEPAELHRVYPPAAERNGADSDAPQRYAVPDAALAEANLRAAGLVVEVGILREQLGDTRRDRDAWREQAQRLALPKPEPEPEPQSWWRWLRSSAAG
jgi:hypothetical protein